MNGRRLICRWSIGVTDHGEDKANEGRQDLRSIGVDRDVRRRVDGLGASRRGGGGLPWRNEQLTRRV
jgi:hypothetical protein